MIKLYINRILYAFRNFIKYVRKGGVVYVNVSQLSKGGILKDKRVLITGGTSGIGYAIAQKFLSEGADVLITGRSAQRLNEAMESLGDNVRILEWDVADFSVADDKLKQVVELLGGLDIVINNAGVYSSVPFPSVTEKDWDIVMDTNIKGVFFLCQVSMKQLMRNPIGGKILNISSIAGIQGYSSPYGLSKATLNSLTKGLAKMGLSKNIIVNGIAPGNTATPMTGIQAEKNMYDTLSKNGRAALPEEIAEIALFLASDAANNIVGQTIICDGGATLI